MYINIMKGSIDCQVLVLGYMLLTALCKKMKVSLEMPTLNRSWAALAKDGLLSGTPFIGSPTVQGSLHLTS